MDEPQQPDPALRIALAWQPPETRPALAALFGLDQRLAAMVRQAKEPLLGQMRLAWWRDQLGQGGVTAHGGEPLLTRIEEQWGKRSSRLVPLADGWENMLLDAPLPGEAIDAFAAGRAEALAAFADLAAASAERSSAFAAGRLWAMAEFASHASDARERDRAFELAAQIEYAPPRARGLRGISVLGGLARRALDRGEPLLHGRGAVLHAIRLGMLGR